ncbi:hypothetical protein OQA88_10997 [Cercophora sp. LCS_1]
MDDRLNLVHEAHAQTMRWALEPVEADDEVGWDDLNAWLCSGSGLYWPKDLVFAASALGTDEQKSHEGLSRAILFRIFVSDKTLIKQLLPNMWKEVMILDQSQQPELPSLSEIRHALRELREVMAARRTAFFCFVIDGLDEYSGDPENGIAFVNDLAACANIKVIVSSRPIPACVAAFSSRPRLQLQDLTHGDITAYVEDTLSSNEYFESLLQSDHVSTQTAAKAITSEIVTKASGVFLWVILACRSILTGCAAFDHAAELQARLDVLPPELEDLFQHMLGKIAPQYQPQAAKLLRILYQNIITPGHTPVYTLSLAMLDDANFNHEDMDIRPLKAKQLDLAQRRTKCLVMEGRLRSRCCGLLEVILKSAGCLCGFHDEKHDLFVDSHVAFIHRTVFEFLSQPGIWDLSCLRIQDPDFDAIPIPAATHLQTICFASRWRDEDFDFCSQLLFCAAELDKTLPSLGRDFILRLHETIRAIASNSYESRPGTLPSDFPEMGRWLSLSGGRRPVLLPRHS